VTIRRYTFMYSTKPPGQLSLAILPWVGKRNQAIVTATATEETASSA